RSDAPRQSRNDRRGNAAEHARPSCRLAARLADDQARQPHAAERRPGRGPAGARRLPGDAEVSRPAPVEDPERELPPAIQLPDEAARLERVWSDGSGFYCWLKAVNHKAIGRRYI